MSEEPSGLKVQPIILGTIIALLLATLVFILATGDYGESANRGLNCRSAGRDC